MFEKLFLSALAVLAAVALPGSAAAQAPGMCVITNVEGAAVVSARGAGRHRAEAGLGLGRNAILRTRPEARVTMVCSDDLVVVLGPDSELSVAQVVDAPVRPVALRLMDGIAGFLLNGDGGDGVQVRTPSAVAAVRSTEWAMRVQDRATAIFARDGTVFVVAQGDTTRLGPGDGVDVSADGVAGPVVRWGQPRIDLFADLLGPDW